MDPEFWSKVSRLWIKTIDQKTKRRQKKFDNTIKTVVTMDPDDPLLDDDYEEEDDF